jgi:hypothetical protein
MMATVRHETSRSGLIKFQAMGLYSTECTYTFCHHYNSAVKYHSTYTSALGLCSLFYMISCVSPSFA